MKSLFDYLRSCNDTKNNKKMVISDVSHTVDRSIDMKAFSKWCQELGVSRLFPKDNEVKIIIGDHVKYVKFDRI